MISTIVKIVPSLFVKINFKAFKVMNTNFYVLHLKRLAAVALLTTALAGCQTTGTTGLAGSGATSPYKVAKASYSFFYDQGDHLAELVAAGNFQDASTLYEEQRTYFDQKVSADPEVAEALTSVANEVSRALEPEIAQTLSELNEQPWPTARENWKKARVRYRQALNILSITPSDGVFVNPAYRPASLAELKSEAAAYTARLEGTVDNDFDTFDHFGGTPFFDLHPLVLGPREYFDEKPETLAKLLDGRSAEEIGRFAAAYRDRLGPSPHWTALGNAYVDARLADDPKKSRSLASVLDVIRHSRRLGFDVGSVSSVKVGFVEVTSRTLLKQGQIQFPAEVEVDLPFDTSKADLESALDPASLQDNDYLVVFDVALAKTQRKVGRMRRQPSEMIVGYRQEPNPEYRRLQNSLNMAQMSAQNAKMNHSMRSNQFCQGLGCIAVAIASAAAAEEANKAQDEVQRIMTEFNATNPMIEVPIKQTYSYEVADLDATKTMTVHYYVIDKAKKRYFKSTFDITENEKFGVAYRIAESDPSRSAHIAKHDTEEKVADWERKPSTVKLSQLVDHYVANQGKTKPLTSLTALRQEMLKDRNTAIASFKTNTFEESTTNDPRFDSVVAIYMPGGGLGSGFFVRPDVVMTNYHVVDEGDYAELKMHDEQETFGKVIARDAVLDLALIKVQTRGKPVRFFDRNKIDLGSTVEVIGHPQGYEFSITRGVVSAVRKEKSVNLQGTGSDVLQVQIDAATSPGNSGGPVFMKDYVISVVSWGRVDRGSENLNFTIHHSEAERFLRDNLGGGS